MKVGIGRVIGWLIFSIVMFVSFILATIMKQTQLVLLMGAALVMSSSATYITYKNYKGQKDKKQK